MSPDFLYARQKKTAALAPRTNACKSPGREAGQVHFLRSDFLFLRRFWPMWFRACELLTNDSQSSDGNLFFWVKISTMSPDFSSWFKGAISPFTLAPVQAFPMSVWI